MTDCLLAPFDFRLKLRELYSDAVARADVQYVFGDSDRLAEIPFSEMRGA